MRRGPTTRRALAVLAAALLGAAARASAAQTPRAAHSATLLPTGHVLIAGGYDETGTVVATAELKLTARDHTYSDVASMNVARASHTATLLPNGRVLVTGGINAGGTALSSAEVYDPASNAWTLVAGMQHTRYNHTATRLQDGRVLVCGGQNQAGTLRSSCDFFTAAGAGGSFSAAPDLLFGRALHTATLLRDGKVWIAGGWNPAAASTWLPTTERFDPGANAFSSAHPLASARGLHTAVMLGDGKVLVSGGFNAQDVLDNRGFLDTQEVYDPISNTVTPADSLDTRRAMHSATLSSDGRVQLAGGLGNITTTYVVPSLTMPEGSILNTGFYRLPVGTITSTGLTIDAGVRLGKAAVGVIREGYVLLSTPSISFPSGVAYFANGLATSPATGLQLELNGFSSDCSAGPCGTVSGDFPILNTRHGRIVFFPANVSPTGRATSGSLAFTGSPLATGEIADLTPASANVVADVEIALGEELEGAAITSGTIVLNGGSIVQSGSFTITLDGGYATIPAGTVVGPGGVTAFSGNFRNLNGTIVNDRQPNIDTPLSVPLVGGFTTVSLSGVATYVADRVDVSGLALSVDVATIVVRSMLFATPERHDPEANSAALDSSLGVTPAHARFGHTTTLLPNNDVLSVGGLACADATCSAVEASNLLGERQDFSELRYPLNFAASGLTLGEARTFHTSTLLPDGTILTAGGTNGSILASAELLDPETGTLTPVGRMRDVRDLHTATLLPNGRVLVAGGFTTTSASTASTNAAELYDPATRLFYPTSVMVSSRSNHTATLMPDGAVMLVGGYGPGDVATRTAELYYSTSARWGAAASLPVGQERALHSAALLKDGRLMVIGGINAGGPLSSVYAYDPATNAWTALASLPRALYSLTATLLLDGRVLVAGGNDGFGEYNASYIYTPGANTWTSGPHSSGPLLQARFGHTATLLPDGNVMISGGANRFGTILDEIEFYHVNASSWVAGGSRFALGRRAFHTVTLAKDGTLYAIGGANAATGGSGSLLGQIESGYFAFTPDGYTPGAPPSVRQSTIASVGSAPVQAGGSLSVAGRSFLGATDADGGGSASASSAFSLPRLMLQRAEGSGGGGAQSPGGFAVDLSTQIYLNASNASTLDTAWTVTLPASNELPAGWYAARVGANAVYSTARMLQVGPARPASAPSGLTGTVLDAARVSWSWTALGGVDGYNVYQATSGVFLGTAAASGSPSFLQAGLAPNTTASVVVAGYTLSGDGPLAASATYYTLAAAPSSVRIASVTFGGLLLEWSASSNTAGTIYEVSQSTDDFSTAFSTPIPAQLGLTSVSVGIDQLSPYTTYYFRVRAYGTGGLPSAFSATVSTRTRTAVLGVSSGAWTSSSVTWTWSPGGAAITSYRVYNSTTGQLLATVASPAFVDTGLAPNSQRSVMVAAVTDAGEGPLSPGASAYTLALVPAAGNPPATSIGEDRITLNWAPNGNPAGTTYRVRLSSGGGGAVVSTTSFSYAFTGLLPGLEYAAGVSAVNQAGVATDSVEFSTWTLPATPAFSLSPTFLGFASDGLLLQWSTVGNSTNTIYEVTYSTDSSFVLAVSTAVSFSESFKGSTVSITGLFTSQDYHVRVRARNPLGQLSAYSASTHSYTTNGGAPLGSLAGVLSGTAASEVTGVLGNGRYVSLRSPGGAFASAVTVTISSRDVSSALCPDGLNVAVSIVDAPALQPQRPLYLTAGYGVGELGGTPTSRIALMRYEPTGCVPLETVFDASARRFTAKINHFSVYQLAQVPLSSSPDSARVFPNPYRAAADGYVTIDRLPPGSRVRVMTLRGETLLDQAANSAGVLTWGAVNQAGRPAASGLYLVVVESGGARKILKLAVVR